MRMEEETLQCIEKVGVMVPGSSTPAKCSLKVVKANHQLTLRVSSDTEDIITISVDKLALVQLCKAKMGLRTKKDALFIMWNTAVSSYCPSWSYLMLISGGKKSWMRNIEELRRHMNIRTYSQLIIHSDKNMDLQMCEKYLGYYDPNQSVAVNKLHEFFKAAQGWIVNIREACVSSSEKSCLHINSLNIRFPTNIDPQDIMRDIVQKQAAEQRRKRALPPVPRQSPKLPDDDLRYETPDYFITAISKCISVDAKKSGQPFCIDPNELGLRVPVKQYPRALVQVADRDLFNNSEYIQEIRNLGLHDVYERKLHYVDQRPEELAYLSRLHRSSSYTSMLRRSDSGNAYTALWSHHDTHYQVTDVLADTLYGIMRRLQNTGYGFLESCPLGMTATERKKFCLRLEFIDSNVTSGGWRDLAELLMKCDGDELNLIEEFSEHFLLSPVEVMLEYWDKLRESPKLYKWPSKSSLIEALIEIGDKSSLLVALNWSSSPQQQPAYLELC